MLSSLDNFKSLFCGNSLPNRRSGYAKHLIHDHYNYYNDQVTIWVFHYLFSAGWETLFIGNIQLNYISSTFGAEHWIRWISLFLGLGFENHRLNITSHFYILIQLILELRTLLDNFTDLFIYWFVYLFYHSDSNLTTPVSRSRLADWRLNKLNIPPLITFSG